jgi:hypothetical protein
LPHGLVLNLGDPGEVTSLADGKSGGGAGGHIGGGRQTREHLDMGREWMFCQNLRRTCPGVGRKLVFTEKNEPSAKILLAEFASRAF